MFHVLVEKFSKSGKFYKACTEKLSAEYAKCSGGAESVPPAAAAGMQRGREWLVCIRQGRECSHLKL